MDDDAKLLKLEPPREDDPMEVQDTLGEDAKGTSPWTRTGSRLKSGLFDGTIVLGNFQLIKRLGEGSFATAYMAKQLGTDRSAVVKIAHPNLVSGRMAEMIQRRFEVEVRASTRVKHANIVTIYTAGDVEGAPAIAMEYVPGETLEVFLVRGAPLTERTFVSLFSQLAQALLSMHRMDIIHRDVSPRNIIIQIPEPGQLSPKLLDFGISQIDGEGQHTMGPIGTPQFMAPEILRGETSKAADVFSLGSLMWWAATGKLFIPTGLSQPEIFKFLTQMRHRPDLGDGARQLSPGLRVMLRRALSPEPSDRPGAAELVAIFAEHTRGGVRDSTDLPALDASSSSKERALLLTTPNVSHAAVADALDAERVAYQRLRLMAWQEEQSSLSAFDMVFIPIDSAVDDDEMRFTVLELAAARMRSKGSTLLHAYSDGAMPREPLGRMGVDACWSLPLERDSMRLALRKARGESTTWLRVNSDVILRTLEEDSEAARELIDDFIGGMPEWLLELEEALEEEDRSRLFSLCGELSSRAMSVGAENVLAITREMCGLSPGSYSARGVQLLETLEAEYKLLFHELKSLRRPK